jgi:hypothetical protein
MQTVRSRDHAGGYRLGPWDVERLVQVLGGDEKVTGVAVDLSDGTSLRLSHAGEILEVPNADGRAIVGLTVESAPAAFLATPDDPARLALVRLRDRHRGPVSWYLSGDERAVQRLAEALDDWVASITPWYGGIATASPVALGIGSLAVLGLLSLVVLALYVLVGGAPPGASSVATTGMAAVRGTAVAALLLFAGTATLANLRRDRLFPVAQFLVGAGDERDRRFARRRRWLLGAGSLAAVLAAAGSLLAGLAG